MNVLSIDPGTRTGWAALCNGRLYSGVQDFTLRRGESGGIRFLRFDTWLEELIQRANPKVVVYEQQHHRGGSATEICVGLVTGLQRIAAAHAIEYASCHTATLKKFATGTGKAGKQEMLQAAQKMWPEQQIETHDQAEALWLLAWARRTIVGEENGDVKGRHTPATFARNCVFSKNRRTGKTVKLINPGGFTCAAE